MPNHSPDEKQLTSTAAAIRGFDKLSEADHIDLGTRVSTPAMIDAMRLIDAEYHPVVDALREILSEWEYGGLATRRDDQFAVRGKMDRARAALAKLER